MDSSLKINKQTNKNQQTKNFLTTLIIIEMQTKNIMRYHIKQARMAIIKNAWNNKGKMVWSKGNPPTVGENENWCSPNG